MRRLRFQPPKIVSLVESSLAGSERICKYDSNLKSPIVGAIASGAPGGDRGCDRPGDGRESPRSGLNQRLNQGYENSD
jgi:hypothetical protein